MVCGRTSLVTVANPALTVEDIALHRRLHTWLTSMVP